MPFSEDAAVPVPAFLPDLRATDGSEMTISVLRTLAALVYNAFDYLGEAGRSHRISTKVLRAYVGGERHAGTDQIRDGLAWLAGTKLGVPSARSGISAFLVEAPLIKLGTKDADGRPSLISGVVEYRFSEAARSAFALTSSNRTFFNLELGVLTGTRSVVVARLYMILAQHANRRDPVFRAETGELCDRLGIPPDSTYRRNGGLLKAKVIGEVVALIDRLSGFRVVRTEYATGGKGGRIQEVLFEVAPKQGRNVGKRVTPSKPRAVGFATGLPGLLASIDVFLGDLPTHLRFREEAVKEAFADFVSAVKRKRTVVDPMDNGAVWEAFEDFLVDRQEERLRQQMEELGPPLNVIREAED